LTNAADEGILSLAGLRLLDNHARDSFDQYRTTAGYKIVENEWNFAAWKSDE
jgi:hypothetical protein